MPHRSPRFAALLAAALLGVASMGACTRSDSTPAAQAAAVPQVAPTASAPATSAKDSTSAAADKGRIRGVETTPVWLIEISDFQCPYCKKWHDEVYPVLDREYVQTGKIRIAYINFPLTSIHANAQAASEAAMCASAQGKFWELHDGLFATQEKWEHMTDPTPAFDSLATASKADPVAWRACMTSHATAPLITADRERASRSGVRSTPSFFIGTRGLIGSYPADSFRVVLDSAIAAAHRAH